MGLMPAYFTTTNFGRKKAKKKSGKQIQEELQRVKRLKRLGYKPNTDKNPKILKSYSLVKDLKKVAATSDIIPGSAPKPKENHYSGQRQLLGIFTMHKSNMVPVFADNKQVAEDIAKMRR